MQKYQRYISLFCFLFGCSITQVMAIDLATPPPDGAILIPMTFYGWSFTYGGNAECEVSQRDLDVAVSGNEIYVKGLSVYYPDGWLKGCIVGDTIRFHPCQLYFPYPHKEAYFYPACFKNIPLGTSHGEGCGTWVWTATDSPFVLGYATDRYLQSASIENDITTEDGFFFTDTTNPEYQYNYSKYIRNEVDTWTGKDAFYGHIQFIGGRLTSQLNEILISEHIHEDNDVYNLQGRKIDKNNLSPGIYIRNGKKFVVK